MHRLNRNTLEAELAVRLKRAITANKQRLGSRLALESDAAIDAVVAELLGVIDNESTCVVRAETVHAKMAVGKFGADEPWPGEAEIIMVPRLQSGPKGD